MTLREIETPLGLLPIGEQVLEGPRDRPFSKSKRLTPKEITASIGLVREQILEAKRQGAVEELELEGLLPAGWATATPDKIPLNIAIAPLSPRVMAMQMVARAAPRVARALRGPQLRQKVVVENIKRSGGRGTAVPLPVVKAALPAVAATAAIGLVAGQIWEGASGLLPEGRGDLLPDPGEIARDVWNLGPGLPFGDLAPFGRGSPFSVGGTIPGRDEIVKTWDANGTPFAMLRDRRIAVMRRDGTIKVYRPRKHVVVSSNPKLGSFLRAERRLRTTRNRLKKALR